MTIAAKPDSDPGYAALREQNYCRIRLSLEALYRITGPVQHRYLVVEPAAQSGLYVQCLFALDRSSMLCEAASGRWLKPQRQLVSTARLPALLALGFAPDPGDGNYHLERAIAGEPDLPAIAELYLRTLYDVFAVPPDAELRLKAPLLRRLPYISRPLDRDCRPLIS